MERDISHNSVGDWLGVEEGCAETDGTELGDDDGGAIGPSLGAVLVVGELEDTDDGLELVVGEVDGPKLGLVLRLGPEEGPWLGRVDKVGS